MSASSDFEDLLSDCIRRVGEEGPEALEAACTARPDVAARLREHVSRLIAIGLLHPSGDAPLPARVGDYEIACRLGRGGMGVVYLARDPRDGSRVALKTGPAPIERGERSTARFEREMRAFAGLRHENLVRVLDVGADDGRPFYVMEYVRGATLSEILDALRAERRTPTTIDVASVRRIVTDAARRADAGSESSNRDAEIGSDSFGRTWIEFACRAVSEVAHALAHVHAAGVVHRDVKPGNVIVRVDGRALLFDLGLAHVDNAPDITGTGDFAGTPHYVSPEVARGDVRAADARSDVFSLGVTLYELVTLRKPFDGPNAQRVLAAIAEREPLAPRRVEASLPRDLETICLTALEKDAGRRYASMEEFAADLERFLSFRPVRARPIGNVRRAMRFARRRPAVAAALALAALVVVGVPGGLYVANRAIRGERDRAERAAREAERQARTSARVAEFLVDLFHAPAGREADVGAAAMLERGARRAESDFDDQPLVRAALLEALGVVHANAGEHGEALPLFDRALAIRQRALGESHADTARVLRELGELQAARGDVKSARALLERAWTALRASEFAPAGDEARVRRALGDAWLAAGDARAALPHLDAAVDAQRSHETGTSSTLARTLEVVGRARLSLGDTVGARTALNEALDLLQRAFVPDLAARARVLALLADALEREGRAAEAAPYREEAELLGAGPRRRDDAGATPVHVVNTTAWSLVDGRDWLASFDPSWRREWQDAFQDGITALQSGDHAVANASFRRCLELRPFDAVCAYNLACAATLVGDLDAGVEWLRRAADMDAGRSPALLAVIEADADTARLRADPRAVDVLSRMRADAARGDDGAWEFVPEGASPPKGRPVLVVLRDGTASKDRGDERDETWKELARATDAVLVRPVARWRTSADDDAPRAWVDALPDFAKRPWAYEEPIVDALRDASARHGIDRDRVFLVGVESGALVAFDLAVRAPGLFSGVLLVDGPVHATLSIESAYTAAAAGSEVRAIVSAERGERAATLTERFLEHCGFGADRVRVSTARDACADIGTLRTTLTELLSAPR